MFNKFYKFYEIFPKIDVKYNTDQLLRILGNNFALLYYRDENILHLYLRTNATVENIRNLFGVKDAELPQFNYYARAFLKHEKHFYEDLEFQDLNNLLAQLQPGQGIFIIFKLEPSLHELHFVRINKLQKLAQYSEKHKIIINNMREKIKDSLYLIDLYLLDNDRRRLKSLTALLSSYSMYPLFFEIPLFKTDVTKLYTKDISLSYLYAILNEKKWLHLKRSSLDHLLIIPNAATIPVLSSRGTQLPTIIPDRPSGFKIGVNPETGKEVRLELEDLVRHSYIIGGTGAGKTSAIATIVTRFMKAYPESVTVIVDPNGDFAEQLASSMADYEKLIYVDPAQATVSVNPLSLPDEIPQDQALLLAESNVKEIFEQLFSLKAGAVYVEYIVINALKILYMKTRSPTFRDLYNVIMKLRSGEIDLPVKDPQWEEKLAQFQELEETSYISALSRLEEYATNPLLVKLFSNDSIKNVLEPGNLVVINASNAQIGSKASFLMIAGWIYKLWYSALVRAALRQKRIPVLTVIDEFEVISDLSILEIILSQARKFGMHLILAHQHTDQVKDLLKSIFSNTAIKVLMRTAGNDAKNLSQVDPGYASQIESVLPTLSPGEAVMFVMPRKSTDVASPFRIKFDYTELKFDQDKLDKVIARMKEKYKTTIENRDVTSLVNPLFRYIEKPNVLEQVVLHNIYEGFADGEKHSIYLVDLLKRIGIDRDKIENVINKLEAAGYISVEKVKNKKLLRYGKGLFGDVKTVAPSSEGRKIAMKVMLKYMKKGYYVTTVRQSRELTARPDLVALPINKSTYNVDYEKAIAIEIESCNELETHPEQVIHNFRKESVKDFSEVHSWTLETCFNKLLELYNQLSDEEKKKVKIFALKIREKEEKKELGKSNVKNKQSIEVNTIDSPVNQNNEKQVTALSQDMKNAKEITETGTTEEEQIETTTVYSPVNNTDKENQITAPSHEEKTISIKDVTIQVVTQNSEYYIVKLNNNAYKVRKSEIDDLEAIKDLVSEIEVKENEIWYKIGDLDYYTISLEPL
ncbi:type IV secretion system DNA-binding domain-containing protein [Sulfolobus tengchongensis]|uniref:Type IV secretion system DNA-binding domain-containing protein n=1 Tax=Sulfolobus tengchongensis TaxID=207809 RepID=A0AAX4L236_9CREN